MNERAFLCYVNAKDDFFDNTSFNFDNEYFFRLEVDECGIHFSYKLCVSKRNLKQPEGFWGKNISAVSVITGENGSGKTSLMKFITNNIGSAITALNGEGAIYVVNQNGTYIVFHNCMDFSIQKTDEASEINIFTDKEYSEFLIEKGDYKPPFDNRRFWKNIIFFSNYFGTTEIRKSKDYIIDVSKNNGVREAITAIDSMERLSSVTIQGAYQNFINMKTFNYSLNKSFQELAVQTKISVPDLLRFKLKYTLNDYGNFFDKEKFSRDKWIGINRYEKFQSYPLRQNEREFEFEAAINKFSVDLLLYLVKEKVIDDSLLTEFIKELADTKEETGISIAIRFLQSNENTMTEEWIQVLKFLNKKDKYFVLYWQNSQEFTYRWDIEDAELIKKLISSNESKLFYQCDLVGSGRKGHYSSGEESKVNLLISMFSALEKINENIKMEDNRNIILLLDEVDAYYHPQFQINLVGDILELVSKIFVDYQVQIILTCNTPLELSDFPASNIIYIKNGSVDTIQNEVNTFGSNVCSLLKNNFYINSTMGTFAKSKINEIIGILVDETNQEIDQESIRYLISIIGEPIIKNKLEQMYYSKFPDKITDNRDKEIAGYKNQIEELRRCISNGKSIDTKLLEQLEDELIKVTKILQEIKR